MPAVPLSQVAVHLRPRTTSPSPPGTCRPGLEVAASTAAPSTLAARIGLGHKFALRPISKGEAIYKYGQIIGFASQDIAAGDHVHVHNVAADAFERDYAFCRDCPPPPAAGRAALLGMGYDRGDGRYGTRNYIAIISTVNCSASTSKYISERFRATDLLKQYPNVDGVVAITHKAGCAMQYDGPDHHQLDRTLAGFARHPNVAAYILIGLGCETGQAIHLIENEGLIQLNGSRKQAAGAHRSRNAAASARRSTPACKAVAELLPQRQRRAARRSCRPTRSSSAPTAAAPTATAA